MSESGTTFWRPSVVQKRFAANGRSDDTTSTTAFGSLPADSLNLRVEVAHTEVSRLGTMFRIFFFPLKSASETSFRSVPVSLKSGAFAPTAGNSPFVRIGVPLNVTCAMCSASTWNRRVRPSCNTAGPAMLARFSPPGTQLASREPPPEYARRCSRDSEHYDEVRNLVGQRVACP